MSVFYLTGFGREYPEREITIMPQADEKKAEETKVEDTTTQVATEETTSTETDDAQIDYDAEFNQEVEKIEVAEKNRKAYLQRKGITEEPKVDQDEIDARVQEALKKAIPTLQSTLVQDTVETELERLASGNEAKKKLIRFHFENSVGLNGTIKERMENALLITDKKTILKTQKELAVALQNRQGLSNSGQGTSTEGMQVKDNFFSQEQLSALKAKGWDDKKIQRLKENLQKGR